MNKYEKRIVSLVTKLAVVTSLAEQLVGELKADALSPEAQSLVVALRAAIAAVEAHIERDLR